VGGLAARASERVERTTSRLREVMGEERSDGELRREVTARSRGGAGGGWTFRWSSSERQRAGVETTPRGCGW